MVTLHIEHKISDFATWCAAFDRFRQARLAGGVRAERVYRPIDDAGYVLIDLDFATVEHAQAFRDFLSTRVWTTPDNAPALVGTPLTRILAVELPAA